VLTKFSSAFLAFLLAGSLLWGPCAACAAAPLKTAGHDCCHPGNCRMPAPKQPAAKVCPNLALAPAASYKVSVPQVASPALAVTATEALTVAVVPLACWSSLKPNPSPPGLYALNSVLRV